MNSTDSEKPKLVGINHVALEVGNIEEALEFYSKIFQIKLRSKLETKAFIDIGDQFIALAETEEAGKNTDKDRHFGLVVDNPEKVEQKLREQEINTLDTSGLDFKDPWGNRIQIIGYGDIQFTKADHILKGMNLENLEKTEDAISQLKEKGMSP